MLWCGCRDVEVGEKDDVGLVLGEVDGAENWEGFLVYRPLYKVNVSEEGR